MAEQAAERWQTQWRELLLTVCATATRDWQQAPRRANEVDCVVAGH